jgi:hypothetical protein
LQRQASKEITMRSRSAVVVALLALAACSNGSDSRCNLQNCQAMLNCHVTLQGAGSLVGCATSFQTADFYDAGLDACIQACNAQGNGAILACVAANFPGNTCLDVTLDGGMTFNAIEQTCGSDAGPACGPNCMTCETACGQTESTCETNCGSAADAGACFACGFECGQASVACSQACPTN